MGRYSDSDDDKKKRKKKKKKRSRSRSRSESIESRHSTKQKKSKKSKRKYKSRSRSRSSDRYRRSRSYERRRSRSRSRSYDRRSRSRDRYRRRSRSSSRDRYSRSRSRDRRRRRSRSYDRSRRSSSRRSRSYSPVGKKDKRKRSSKEREDPCSSIPGFADMTPTEQAKIRMQMALKAAAAADEKLKGDPPGSSSNSFQDSFAFTAAIQDIESSGFTASSFKSSRGEVKKEDKENKDEFTFGTAGELRLDPSQRKPVIIDVDTEELAHPNFYADPEEKMDRWIQKLTTMRRKKLEGEALA